MTSSGTVVDVDVMGEPIRLVRPEVEPVVRLIADRPPRVFEVILTFPEESVATLTDLVDCPPAVSAALICVCICAASVVAV